MIKNWGDYGVACQLDGVKQAGKKTFRYGINRTLESKDLIVWIAMNSREEIKILIIPQSDD